jgi:hypothetical protein
MLRIPIALGAAVALAMTAASERRLPSYCKLKVSSPVKVGRTVRATTKLKCTRKVRSLYAMVGVGYNKSHGIASPTPPLANVKSGSVTSVYHCRSHKRHTYWSYGYGEVVIGKKKYSQRIDVRKRLRVAC